MLQFHSMNGGIGRSAPLRTFIVDVVFNINLIPVAGKIMSNSASLVFASC